MAIDPAFRRVEVSVEDLQALFDLATNSMDFGSGFWENDDVPAVRRIALSLGVDPMEATPGEYKHRYPHAFVAEYNPYIDGPRCQVCRKPEHGEIIAPEIERPS